MFSTAVQNASSIALCNHITRIVFSISKTKNSMQNFPKQKTDETTQTFETTPSSVEPCRMYLGEKVNNCQ